MTDDNIKTLKDDIAFMRALAQEGQRTPLLGGAIMVAAGLTFAVASLVQWAVVTGVLQVTQWILPATWGTALVVFLVTVRIIRMRMGGKPGASSPGNRASGLAWAGVGWTIFTMATVLGIVCYRANSGIPMMVFPSLILALYGLGWSVAAAMSKKGWIWGVAIGSYASALLAAWFATTPMVFLIYAGALILLASLPGYVLMRQEPSDTI